MSVHLFCCSFSFGFKFCFFHLHSSQWFIENIITCTDCNHVNNTRKTRKYTAIYERDINFQKIYLLLRQQVKLLMVFDCAAEYTAITIIQKPQTNIILFAHETATRHFKRNAHTFAGAFAAFRINLPLIVVDNNTCGEGCCENKGQRFPEVKTG